MSDYINLHCHSDASSMDGYSSIEEYLVRAKEVGMDALAITEHGTTSSWRKFQRLTKDSDVKPILGLEAYLSPTDRFDKRAKANREEADSIYNHLIVIAKNDNGLKNINSANRIAHNEGFYMKPRWDFDLLAEYSEDLIVLSGCLNGVLAKAFDRGDIEAAYAWAKRFTDVFGDNFYIEIQTHNPPSINEQLIGLGDELGIGIVVTDDCHHASPEDRIMQEIFLILSTHPKMDRKADIAKAQKLDLMERFDYLYPDRKMTFKNFELYLQGYDEKYKMMESLGYKRQDFYTNTLKIADGVQEYSYEENLETLPNFSENPTETLRINVQRGLEKKGLANKQNYQDRITRELDVILGKNFANYFLIVEDIIAWSKKQGIRVGRGRGSAAGSLACYALGITNVDPLEYNLLFERFLDPERSDIPDVDIDFQDSRREEVKQYAINKYGHVANITTVNTYQGKKAIKDAARVIGVPYGAVNKATKVLNGISEVTGHDVIHEFKKGAIAFNKQFPDVVKIAEKLHGRITGYGMHAAGVIIANRPISDLAPIETRKPAGSDERIEVVGIDKDECESLGLIKMDFLGLTALSIVDDCVKLIKENKGILIDTDAIPLDDKAVYEMLASGNTQGIFQCEAAPYTKLLVKMGCSDFNDLTVSNALVRPGAWNAIGEDYIEAKKGIKKPQFIHEDVRSYMDDTFGYPVYQEQMMRLSVDLAGFTVGESNKLRKGIGKKKREIVDAFRPQFIEGASKKISKALAEKLWRSFEEAGAYAFNLSHAVAYSMLSVQTAWLKKHYPQEFMCAVLKNEKNNDSITDYLLECKNMGIKILLPHVNKSGKGWTIEGDALRMGLSGVKYISDTLAERIIAERPYVDYADFKEYVLRKGSGLNTRVLSSLNKFGGASFTDNPRCEDYKDNLFEFLGIPAFDNKLVTKHMREQLLPLEEYADDETFITLAMVKQVKRGEGWARVDMIDSTATAGVFTEPDTEIAKGQMYIFVVGNNRIIKEIPLTSGGEFTNSEEIIIDFLRRPVIEEIPLGQFKILAASKRITKAGNNMATLVIADGEKNIRTAMVFSREFEKVRATCPLGSVRALDLEVLKGGTVCVKDVH